MDTSTDAGGPAKAYCWSFGRAEFDESRWELRVAGQPAALERKPLEVLHYLLRHAGEVVTKEELLAEVWAGRIVVEAVLTNAVGKLRKALEEDGQEIVTTLSRVGYRLAVPVSRRPVEFVPEDSRLQVGDAVPRRENWKLETALARTGGNEVWLARHTKTRETRVFKFSLAGKGLHALKREVTIARLLREALGERDDFVHVIDWDFDRAPYFVESEYGGTGLDHWPEEGRVSDVPLATRLALFADAVDAVAAAHGVGVLHKDLKPANLLVYEVDGVPRLRVADFGSSRLLDSGWLDQLGITHLGMTQTQAITSDTSGTPLYLAPELAAGQASTVKSDIYALGVTLYQLVVGDFRRPLAAGWENDVLDPLLQQDIADAANGDPAKRPDSAALLAERIRTLETRREQRALEEAVRARIADGEKRLAKVRARRPWMIAAMVLLSAGLVASSVLLKRSHDAEQVAAEQRDKAAKQAKRSEAVVNFLSNDLLRALAPGGMAFEKEPTINDMLEYASGNIDGKFKDDPATLGSVHSAIGASWSALDQREHSSEHFRKAWENYKQAFGEADEQTLLILYDYAEEVISNEKYADAERLLDEADRLSGPRLQESGKLALWSARRRSNFHVQQQQPDEAEPYLKRGIELLPKVLPDMPRLEGIFRIDLADVYRRQGKDAEAEALVREGLADPRFTPERIGTDVMNALQSNLSMVLMKQGRYAEALTLAEAVAASAEKLSGIDARSTIIEYERVAKIHTSAGNCEEALEIRRRNWKVGVEKHGMADRSNLANGANLAANEEKCGDKSVAPALLQQVLAEVRRSFGPDDPFNHTFGYFYARMLIDSGRYTAAQTMLRSISIEKLNAATGPAGWEHWLDAQRGRILIGLGQKEEGRKLLARALDAQEKRNVPANVETIATYRKLLTD